MAPYGGLTHSLPLLGKIFQWFMSDHLKVEGFLFHLHQKVTSFLVLVGLLFITIENYLDSRSIVCKDNGNAYSRQFCWMHGYSYIEPHLQGREQPLVLTFQLFTPQVKRLAATLTRLL